MNYVHPITGVIHTGYALVLNGKYITLTMDFFSRGMSYAPCNNQDSPHMRFTLEEAESAIAKVNEWIPGITIVPLRYCDGEWIDHPSTGI